MSTMKEFETPRTGLLARTWANMQDLWHDLAGDEDSLSIKPQLTLRDRTALKKQMIACLEGHGGEVSARQRAARLGEAYLALDTDGRRKFLTLLSEDFAADHDTIENAIKAWHEADTKQAVYAAENALRRATEAPRLSLLTQFNALPQGVKFLVDMRADLQRFLKEDADLRPLDDDLKSLLISWFDIGFLEIRSITWDSPASLLEKLMAYEAVHEIQSWHDLRNRLESDRRLYAFFHPRMPDEPLIFVEVALVNGLAGNIHGLLDEKAPTVDPTKADTAIFYSINNTQAGLRGVSFGNFLIKRVVDELRREFPNLKTFSTLSPVPGFRSWLSKAIQEGSKDILRPEDRKRLKQAKGRSVAKGHLPQILDEPGWINDADLCEALKAPLLRLCARYLLQEKKGLQPLDPVARFHLNNGALVERICWLGDRSKKGRDQSASMMVNYLYRLNDIEKNHERFAEDGRIAASSAVRSLL